ncbi:TnsD family Tn7-like transposition protein [Vibrio sp. F74]|uniref:TnsD family Tn7-like transposition protein n=1 Tax=Vibrio sp. F74 TaxID=700020 RepID=UPI0035F5E18C
MLCLPNVLPDELVFSRIIRFLMASGQPVSKFLLAVYGSSRASIHPYLTAGLSNLAELADEDINSLLYQQTLAPLFIHCLPAHSTEIYSALLSNDNCSATRTSQLSCVREREPLSLKYCPQCVMSDVHEYGVSFWHRSHQTPGIESCSKHPTWLVHAEIPGRIRTNIGLPVTTQSLGESTQVSFELAKYAKRFLLANEDHYPTVGFEYYRKKLRELGYVTRNNSFRRRLLSSDFYQFTCQLRYPSDNLLPQTQVDYKYLSYLLRENASQQPFKHILFSYWLKKAEPIECSCSVTTKVSNIDLRYKKIERCLTLLRKGKSIASISREVGKSRCFVKAVALNAKDNTRLKPRKLTSLVCQTAIALAIKGFHRKEIARRLSVSIGSIETIISASDGIVEWRKKCKSESKRRRYQLQIIRYRQLHPQAIRLDIKSDCNAAFFWLYQHEKMWLEGNLPEATPPHPSPRAKCGRRFIQKVREKDNKLNHFCRIDDTL